MDSVNASNSPNFLNKEIVPSREISSPSLTSSKSSEKDVNFSKSKDLSSQVSNSGNDVRYDVVERAKQLVNDPNWLNDSNLSNLSSRLLVVEDF